MHVITLPRAHRASYIVQVGRPSTAKPDGTKWPPYTSIQTKLMSYLAEIEPCCLLHTQQSAQLVAPVMKQTKANGLLY